MKLYAFSGSMRSGTRYIAYLMQDMGIDVRHETIGNDGISWWYVANFRFCNLPEVITLHQIRNPLSVISSTTMFNTRYHIRMWRLASKGIGVRLGREGILHRAMKYWYHWNLLVEKKATYRYRIEDIEKEISVILKLGGYEIKQDRIDRALSRIKKKTNTKPHKDYTWENLEKTDPKLTKAIRELGRKYGYDV